VPPEPGYARSSSSPTGTASRSNQRLTTGIRGGIRRKPGKPKANPGLLPSVAHHCVEDEAGRHGPADQGHPAERGDGLGGYGTFALGHRHPVQVEGGVHVPPDGYLRAIREACHRAGALMIADEVQTCIGRAGTRFACDRDGVAPDVTTLAKQLGGGIMPIGATTGTASVWEKVFSANPLMHTSTFGGNPLACAAGLAAVRVVQEEDLVARSRDRGELMLTILRAMRAQHRDLVVDVGAGGS
jgi:acetylornithine/succinyldiaminopimelate/putrescine aminotransferase